jgi:ABC-type hemin transport system ATPase subunit
MTVVVTAESLTKRFGEISAVTDLSFALAAGTITGFLGPNGAGKRRRCHQTSGEVAADLGDREVECRFEGTRIAFGLGEQQATLQGGEGAQREPVDIGVVIQLAPVSHAPEPVADRGFPAVEAGRERGPGGFVGLGELAGQ